MRGTLPLSQARLVDAVAGPARLHDQPTTFVAGVETAAFGPVSASAAACASRTTVGYCVLRTTVVLRVGLASL
jgi:hypothetical protein